jgi:hypothetical protein
MPEEDYKVPQIDSEADNEILARTKFHFCTIESLRTYYRLRREDGNDTQVNLVIDFSVGTIHIGPGYKFHSLITNDAGVEGNIGSCSFVNTDNGPVFIHRSGRKLTSQQKESVTKIIKDILELE